MTTTNTKTRRTARAACRAALIEKLGMPPEDFASADTRYVATTGELRKWVAQDFGIEIADSLCPPPHDLPH